MSLASFVTARLPTVIVLTGLCISALAGLELHLDVETNAQTLLQHNTERLAQEVRRQFMLPVYGLRGAAGLYAASGHVSREAFHAYVASRDLEHEFPGVHEFGFIQRITSTQREGFLAAQRADGAPDFSLRQFSRDAQGDHYVVSFMEPPAANHDLRGLDMGASPRLRTAIEQAIDTGQPSLTQVITLAQDSGHLPGLMLCLPVYARGSPQSTPEQRRAALVGVLYASMVASELLEGLVAKTLEAPETRLHVALFDKDLPTSEPELLFDSRSTREPTGPDQAEGRFAAARQVGLLGRTFEIRVHSSSAFDRHVGNSAPWLAFAIGALASTLMAVLLSQQTRRRRSAEAHALSMTDDLARLGLVARDTSNIVVITDALRRITWVNPGFERITGYTAAEALGRSPAELLQFEGTDPVTVGRMRAALDAGQSFSGEICNRSKSGSIYWLELDIQPLRGQSGELLGFFAIESDVTERKLSEAELRSSQDFLDKTGRIGGTGGWSFDLATQTMQWTTQTCRILGLEPEHQPCMDDALQRCDASTRALILRAIRTGFKDGTDCDVELPITTAHGKSIWVRLMAEGEFSDGGLVRIVGALQDITARRALQADLRSNEELLRGAIDAIDEAFVLYDPQDRIVFCNEKYRQIYSSVSDMLLPGTPFEDIIRAVALRGHIPAALGRVDEWVAERMVHHREGNSTFVKRLDNGRILRVVERRMADGHIVGFRIDITELMQASEAAERANLAKSEFIATISHELRTPLQSIMGFSDLGMHFAQHDVQFQQMFTDIHDGGQRMLTLVNGLLDVAKIGKVESTFNKRCVNLAQLAADVVNELASLAQQSGVMLRLCTPLPNWPVEVDAFRLQQVIRNVLANAIRFSPEGSTVEIDGGATPAEVTLTVRDHGPGIPTEELELIFDAFVQSSRTRDGAGGTGLGLTISRKIMRAHGGRIEAGNAPDGGALMRLYLPAATTQHLENRIPA